MNTIIEAIERFIYWLIETGLAEKTADAFARIISFDGIELDKLMWWLTDAIVATMI